MNGKISVVIASANRPEVLMRTLISIAKQTHPPVEVVLSLIKRGDLPPEAVGADFPFALRTVISPEGLTKQRNLGFNSLRERVEFVSFIDDDMVLHRDYYKNTVITLKRQKECVCLMGHLLANGNITYDQAERLIASAQLDEHAILRFEVVKRPWGGLYGCNMNFRADAIAKEPFDERLPLYAELEDMDQGTRIRRHGDVGYSYACLGVHMRTPSGRINQKMLGFSQVMNAAYLARKGTIPNWEAYVNIICRKVLQNFFLVFVPGRRNGRFERLTGNLFALKNISLRRIAPELIEELK